MEYFDYLEKEEKYQEVDFSIKKNKLLIIFDKNLDISIEKKIIHTGHCNRKIIELLYKDNKNISNIRQLKKWEENSYKNVLIEDKITNNIKEKIIKSNIYFEIIEAGLDGVFKPNSVLGYCVLIEEDNLDFKRLRLLKIKE